MVENAGECGTSGLSRWCCDCCLRPTYVGPVRALPHDRLFDRQMDDGIVEGGHRILGNGASRGTGNALDDVLERPFYASAKR